MRILFIARNTIFSVSGGDTVQVLETAAHLRKLGVEVDVLTTGEVTHYANYDLLHFFNIIRPADILPHVQKSKLPYVVSTIFVDYSEYEKKYRHGLGGFLFKLLHADTVEYLKNIIRSIVRRQEHIPFQYLFYGHSKSIALVSAKANWLLPNSENEYNRLQKKYGVTTRYSVIPNGVNLDLFKSSEVDIEKDDHLIVCAGRVEGRKNQLNLIEAVNNTKYKLLIIGDPAPNHTFYYKLCRKRAASNIEFIHKVPQHQLVSYYKKAKVHVLPSWFETTGLSSLEAGLMGCAIVVAERGDVRDYFGSLAFYCDPSLPASIFKSIEMAASAKTDDNLKRVIENNYTWNMAAAKTLEVYKQILSGTK